MAAAVGIALLLIVRPIIGLLSLRGAPGFPAEHWVIGAFGIRGVGSIYYLAYALSHAAFPRAGLLWAMVGFVVVASVLVYGVAATPVMQLLDRAQERSRTPAERAA